MPHCQVCKIDKPDRAFRLWKKDKYDKAILMGTCMSCENKQFIKCYRCNKVLAWYEIYKDGKRIFYCKKCHERQMKIYEQLERIHIERKLEKLILKIKRMPNNSIDGLRDHLFSTIDELRSGKITPEVAAQITDVAKCIIDSARAENEYIALTGSAGSDFIPLRANGLKKIAASPEVEVE